MNKNEFRNKTVPAKHLMAIAAMSMVPRSVYAAKAATFAEGDKVQFDGEGPVWWVFREVNGFALIYTERDGKEYWDIVSVSELKLYESEEDPEEQNTVAKAGAWLMRAQAQNKKRASR